MQLLVFFVALQVSEKKIKSLNSRRLPGFLNSIDLLILSCDEKMRQRNFSITKEMAAVI